MADRFTPERREVFLETVSGIFEQSIQTHARAFQAEASVGQAFKVLGSRGTFRFSATEGTKAEEFRRSVTRDIESKFEAFARDFAPTLENEQQREALLGLSRRGLSSSARTESDPKSSVPEPAQTDVLQNHLNGNSPREQSLVELVDRFIQENGIDEQ